MRRSPARAPACPNAAAAAQVYPAAYWYAMMAVPDDAQLGYLPGGRN